VGRNRVERKKDPKIKDVLTLLGTGALLTGSLIIPGLPRLAKPFLDTKRKREFDSWERYNVWRLRQVLKRLYIKKYVEVVETNDGYTVRITEQGKKRLLKFDLDTLTLEQKNWDGKWRIIIYDVRDSHRASRDLFRKTLRKLAFLQLQKSVYLTPYPCYDEVEYLRQICSIGTEVIVLTVSGLENEQAYKAYFGL
jgi:CRISPR-associated endonuclease Cas2